MIQKAISKQNIFVMIAVFVFFVSIVSVQAATICYQETATTTSCIGQSIPGSYTDGFLDSRWYDGNWGTSVTPGDGDISYVSYYKPTGATIASKWIIQADTKSGNYTIPTACFNQNPVQFQIDIFQETDGSVLRCYNGVGYTDIETFDGTFFEEAMYWKSDIAEIDCGFKFNDGTGTITAACEPYGTVTSQLRMRKNATTTVGIVLVDTTDPKASRLRIQTTSGVKAVKKYP